MMNNKIVLLVDDELDTLIVLEKQLTAAGFKVVTAKCGSEALLLAALEKPDIIVLDIQMPDMDGGEVASLLKQDPMTMDIPVLYSTCLLSENEGYRYGGKIMLPKSKDSKELIAVINEVLFAKNSC